MAKTNLQVRLPEEMEEQIESLAPHSKSAFIRDAIAEKVRREQNKRLEEQWIRALKNHPHKESEVEDWLKAESWES